MRLLLAADGLARLEEAIRTLLSPLTAPDVPAWQHEAMRTVCDALGAQTGTFTFPGQPNVIDVYGLDERLAETVALFTSATWSGTGTSPEPLLDEFYRLIVQQHIEVWDMHVADRILGGTGTAWNNLFHNEVLQPFGLDDTHALFAPSPQGSAMLAVHNFQREVEPGQHLALLRMLLPAFKAGLYTLARFDAYRAVLDVLTEPLVVFSVDGREIHRNPALALLLAGDPDQEELLGALRRMACSLRALGFGAPGNSTAACTPADQTVTTRKTTYRLHGTLLAASVFEQDGAVMISVTAEAAPSLPSADALRERFGLTRREAEVALLLAEGLSNDALAERLFISRHTARHHTEQVFAKLGLTSRKALALKLLQPA